jgi:ATP-dependent Lon protease
VAETPAQPPAPPPPQPPAAPAGRDEALEIPSVLPILPLKDTVMFPQLPAPLLVGRPPSVQLIDEAVVGRKLVGLVAQKDPALDEPRAADLYGIGTASVIMKMIKFPDGTLRVLTRGLERIRIKRTVQEKPYFLAEVESLRESADEGMQTDALAKNLLAQVQRLLEALPIASEEMGLAFMNVTHPGRLADLVGALLGLKLEQRQQILETLSVRERLQLVTRFINKEIEVIELGSKIQEQVQSEMDETQRKFLLRQQLKAIQKELGEEEEGAAEMRELAEAIEAAGMPAEVRKEADRQLERLRGIPPASAEHSVIRTYLDWLTVLPWSKSTEDKLDIAEARRILDQDHHDLEKVKERILEYLAVRKRRRDLKGPILCFAGPPGTGKTSLGRSIARAMGRKFHRMSLGGVRDEAEIRGHRRTYVGALPGRILEGLRKAGSNNPVFMLDEVDKLGADFRGDPSAALLEVLDPEQNFSFTDHYLDLPFDLSRVMFITTANLLDPVPPPLRDRMEVLELPGYTEEEKLAIARGHLLPRQMAEHALTADDFSIDDDALRRIIREYTREAGVRNLERLAATLCRKAVRTIEEKSQRGVKVRAEDLDELLGPPPFILEVADRTQVPGVAVGLAWTPTGGDILFVEASSMPGDKGLTLTGSLGDVMKESARAALSYLRSRSRELGLADDFFDRRDLHVHVPSGAIPKDGPSAGVAICAALLSVLSGRPCRARLAMTGEITLRGKILPVGGIKEKVLAAARAGILEVVLPERNRKDLIEVPEEVRRALKFHFVDMIDAALPLVLEKAPASRGAEGVRRGRAAARA